MKKITSWIEVNENCMYFNKITRYADVVLRKEILKVGVKLYYSEPDNCKEKTVILTDPVKNDTYCLNESEQSLVILGYNLDDINFEEEF